jgi:hypothetical protein
VQVACLDTCAIDGLADAADSASLTDRLPGRWRPLLPFEAYGEIMACPEPRRKRLLEICRQLIAIGHVALPGDEALKALVARFDSGRPIDPKRFRPFFSRQETQRFPVVPDDIAAQHRDFNAENGRAFSAVFAGAAPKLRKAAGKERPAKIDDLASRLLQGPLVAQVSGEFCKRAGMRNPTRTKVARFYSACPLLRALVLAMIVVPEWEHAFRPNGAASLRAGRNDSIMACMLPYCDCFVTPDGRAREALAQVARLAAFGTRVLGFEEFASSLRV